MGPDRTPARRRRGATAAATALAVASAALFLLVGFAWTTNDGPLANDTTPPVTLERPAAAQDAAERTTTGHSAVGVTRPGPIDTDAQHPAPERDQGSPEPTTSTQPEPDVLERSEPTSIVIPALGVDAETMQLGLHDDRTMEVPPHAPRPESRAGWFRHSPTPGELGPSVIVGHVDSDRHGASVFYGLDSLIAGDRVEVQRVDGSTAVFAVEHVARYRKDEFPTDDVYGDLDHAGLRLITCGGVFDRASAAYEDNIVVYARLVTDHTSPAHEQP